LHEGKLVCVKLTGDGTWIGSRLQVVTFGFTMIDEGETARAACGNYTVCILKDVESYDRLALALQDVRKDVSDIAREGLTVHEEHYQIKFFLGGDWKFLALICGLDAANSKYACIWCTCPKEKLALFS